MRNKKPKSIESSVLNLKIPVCRPIQATERRINSRSSDLFYRVIIGANIITWVLLLVSLVVFHYARPEFITGVQMFWGIDGRDFWLQPHLQHLLMLLQTCLLLSIILLYLRTKRNRRKADFFGLNLFILFALCALGLIALYTSL